MRDWLHPISMTPCGLPSPSTKAASAPAISSRRTASFKSVSGDSDIPRLEGISDFGNLSHSLKYLGHTKKLNRGLFCLRRQPSAYHQKPPPRARLSCSLAAQVSLASSSTPTIATACKKHSLTFIDRFSRLPTNGQSAASLRFSKTLISSLLISPAGVAQLYSPEREFPSSGLFAM